MSMNTLRAAINKLSGTRRISRLKYDSRAVYVGVIVNRIRYIKLTKCRRKVHDDLSAFDATLNDRLVGNTPGDELRALLLKRIRHDGGFLIKRNDIVTQFEKHQH